MQKKVLDFPTSHVNHFEEFLRKFLFMKVLSLEVYSDHCQTYKMECFAKIVNS